MTIRVYNYIIKIIVPITRIEFMEEKDLNNTVETAEEVLENTTEEVVEVTEVIEEVTVGEEQSESSLVKEKVKWFKNKKIIARIAGVGIAGVVGIGVWATVINTPKTSFLSRLQNHTKETKQSSSFVVNTTVANNKVELTGFTTTDGTNYEIALGGKASGRSDVELPQFNLLQADKEIYIDYNALSSFIEFMKGINLVDSKTKEYVSLETVLEIFIGSSSQAKALMTQIREVQDTQKELQKDIQLGLANTMKKIDEKHFERKDNRVVWNVTPEDIKVVALEVVEVLKTSENYKGDKTQLDQVKKVIEKSLPTETKDWKFTVSLGEKIGDIDINLYTAATKTEPEVGVNIDLEPRTYSEISKPEKVLTKTEVMLKLFEISREED